jgi:hypothetical protein
VIDHASSKHPPPLFRQQIWWLCFRPECAICGCGAVFVSKSSSSSPPPLPQSPPPRPSAWDGQTNRDQFLREQIERAEAAVSAKRFHEAAGICQDVLEVERDYPPALALLGGIIGHRGDLARGIGLIERAIRKDRSVAAWFSNLSGLYRMQYRIEEAVLAAREAVRLAPHSARYLITLGKALIDEDNRDEAIVAFLLALAREPANAEAHLAIGQILLARGEWRPGWLEYEWRNHLEQAKGMLPPMTAPAWNGMRLPTGRLLLVGDQGYGDTLQFCRFIPLAAERCQEVVLGCSPELLPLLRNIPGAASCHSTWGEIPPHAVYCLLSSLPGLFDIHEEAIPARVPYLSPDPADQELWAARLAREPNGRGLRIGIAWAGRPQHPNDRRRSIPLVELAPLAGLERLSFVSLQKVIPPHDRPALKGTFPELIDLTQHLTDFAQTAALIANLDLVLSVDTAVAHLAGALGKPVWVMLSEPADWRWMLNRTDSPWYPTMRLFRQPRPGAWAPVIADVAKALAALPR